MATNSRFTKTAAEEKDRSMKSVCCALALTVLLAGHAPGQEWARKMFENTRHDFGTLARGSDAQVEFPLENVFKEDVHIASLRSSCGCSTAEFTKDTLGTWEKGAILVKYNTRAFLGHKDATITVTFDKPYAAEVQLVVSGYIRSDVVLTPGSADFGELELGQAEEKKLSITYAGREDWKITDIKSSQDHFEAKLVETERGGGRVAYDVIIRVKETVPAGYLNQQLVLVTNDQRRTQIPLMATGRILPPVTVSPAALAMGVVSAGQQVTKQLVVRAKRPFRITAVHCDSQSFAFKTDEQTKLLHLIPVTFTADQTDGRVAQKIEIQTDLAPDTPATCVVTATIKAVAGKG